jgi:DNA-directed RNA polymerase specialized sigma24 family protein
VSINKQVGRLRVALIELLSPQLLRFFASQMGNRTDAEDMLQDVWLRIHRVRHTYRPDEPLLPWVYAIAPACAGGQLSQAAAYRIA